MADLYIFDTDCLSSFLLTNNENILFEIFKDNICLPSQVLNEANKYEPLKIKVDELRKKVLLKLKALIMVQRNIEYTTN